MGEALSLLALGLVQGVADIFPVSSTGHLALLRQILNMQYFDLSLAVGLHGGSLVAIAIFFHREVAILWRNFVDSLGRIAAGTKISFLPVENRLPYLYGLSLVPVAIEGLTLRNVAQNVFGEGTIPLLLLMLNGVIILVTTGVARGERTIKELALSEFLLVGILQGVAVLPGISRLGMVLCTGLLLRLRWQEALKLTFILSIPVVIGAFFVEFDNLRNTLQTHPELIVSLLLGSLFAGLGSWFSLKILTSRLLERRKLALFGYYCLLLGSFSSVYIYFWT